MSDSRTCSGCGGQLPPDAPPGICPNCALEAALTADGGALTQAPSGEEGAEWEASGSLPAFDASAQRGHCFGDYELLEEIARGGMGIVYRARQISLDRWVALKLLPFSSLASAECVKRFRAEASAAAALRHPNIVTVHEVGVHQGQHYLVMNFVNGPPLSRLAANGPLPATRAATYLKIIAETVHYAHDHGILHRDLKPSNVLLDENDQPQVTDFGLAKRLDGESSLTLTGQAVGSPGYMPPEQAAAEHSKVTRRSDVYGLGAMLYHLLAGRPPFQAATLHEAMQLVLDTDPVSLRLLNPNVPRDLEIICLKCLEKAPERRYPTAAAVAEDLGRFLNGEPIQARAIGPIGRMWRWCRRKPVVAALSAAVLALLLVLAVGSSIMAWQFNREHRLTQAALREALFREAQQLRRSSGAPGQRFLALEALAKAAAIRPSLDLRNEAIAALALPDIRELGDVSCPPGAALTFDGSLESYARFVPTEDGELCVSVHRAADNHELLRVPVPATVRAAGAPMFALSRSGRFLVVSIPYDDRSSQIQIWDVLAGRLLVGSPRPERGFPVAFDAREQFVVVGQPKGRILVTRLEEPTLQNVFDLASPANIFSIHPEGRWLAAAHTFANEAVILDLANQARVAARLPHRLPVFSAMDWSPDGHHLAVACGSGEAPSLVQIWAWEAGTAHAERVLRGHQGSIVVVRFMPEGDLLWTGSYDATSRLWSAHLGRQLLATPLQFASYDLSQQRLAFRTHAESYTLRELVTGDAHRLLIGRTGESAPNCVAVSFDGEWVAASAADGVRLWHAPTGREAAFLPGSATCLRFHPKDGSLVVARNDEVVRWPFQRPVPKSNNFTLGPPEILDSPRPRGDKFRIDCSADGRKLACVAGNGAFIMEWKEPSKRLIIPHDAALSGVALSPDGTWAVTCGGGPFQVWRLEPLEKVAELSRPGFETAAFSPDGRWLALSDRGLSSGTGGGRHQIYRVGTWELAAEVPMDHGPWAVHAFSPDNRLLAVRASRSAVKLLETEQWNEVATLEHPFQEAAGWIAFSGDGSQIAISGKTHVVHLWDLREIRRSLREIGLDWDQRPYPPVARPSSATPKVVVLGTRAQ